MQGTFVCGVTDCEEGRAAMELAVELSRRLRLRLVLAHVAEGCASINGADIYHFVASWLPDYARDNRNYLTVAIGCTGGQHRSVYLAERLARNFAPRYQVLVRHRELG